MALLFPCNAAVGQIYEGWMWDGAKWVSLSEVGGGGGGTVGPAGPQGPPGPTGPAGPQGPAGTMPGRASNDNQLVAQWAVPGTADIMSGVNVSITPLAGGRLIVLLNWSVQFYSAMSATVQLRHGTGTVPAQAAAATGSPIGSPVTLSATAAGYAAGSFSGTVSKTAGWVSFSVQPSAATQIAFRSAQLFVQEI